jgi:hypothetical protein
LIPHAGAAEVGADNTSVTNARLIVPDGSSLLQAIASGETRWFAFGIEPAKTYVVEVVDPYSDIVENGIDPMLIRDATGVGGPPEVDWWCHTNNVRAPALSSDTVGGQRCVVRAWPPAPNRTQNKRGVYVAVSRVAGPSFRIRVRESTLYGRWTTNGYDFRVVVDNRGVDSTCAELLFFPQAGATHDGSVWSGAMVSATLTVPPFGSREYVLANGTLVGSDNKGAVRIGACGTPLAPHVTDFVAGSVHVTTYAYNPVTGKHLYFFPAVANDATTAGGH